MVRARARSDGVRTRARAPRQRHERAWRRRRQRVQSRRGNPQNLRVANRATPVRRVVRRRREETTGRGTCAAIEPACSSFESSAAQRGVFSGAPPGREIARGGSDRLGVSRPPPESKSRVRLVVVRGVFGRDAETPRDDDVHAVRASAAAEVSGRRRAPASRRIHSAPHRSHTRAGRDVAEAPGDVRGDASVQRRSRARESSGGGVRQRGDDGTSGSRAKRHRRSLSREEKKRAHGRPRARDEAGSEVRGGAVPVPLVARASAASTSSSTAAASASEPSPRKSRAFDLASAALAPTPGGVALPSSVPRFHQLAAAADLHRTASPGARSIASSSTVDPPRALVAALDTSDGASSSATSESSVRVVLA